MLNKISIRTRVTAITVLLLTTCCVGLTLLLNKSAFKMAETIVPMSTLSESKPKNIKENTNPLSSEIQIQPNDNVDIDGIEIKTPAVITQQAKSTYQLYSIMYMICFIVFGGILTYLITGKALKPINELSNQMKNKTVENLSKEMPLSDKKDEVYELTLSFNKMTRKLNNSFLAQKRFSNSAAHELRTPLTVMRTKLDVFKKRKNPTKEEYDKLIENIRAQLIRLSDLVSSLLSLTNMEDIDLSESVNLKGLIKSVCNDLYYIAEQKHIELNITGEDYTIKGNYDLIYRAFYNLIENSIKYNYENGTVDINISDSRQSIVSIKDSGIGIPDDMKENVFEPFFTVDKSRSRKLGGAGIGLSIVKEVIDKHNGTIIISNNKNKGSIFTIKFKNENSHKKI